MEKKIPKIKIQRVPKIRKPRTKKADIVDGQIEPKPKQTRQKKQKILKNLFYCTRFIKCKEEELSLYCSKIKQSRVYGYLISDQQGRIIFCDKLAHELFDGGLTNLNKIQIQHQILKSQKREILNRIRNCQKFNRPPTF
jgi:hypothetical protein